jgi:hypothetical protein
MRFNPFVIGLGVVITLVLVVIITAALIPQAAHPAYDAAVTFANAAGKGDDTAAAALLNANLTEYAAAQCPQGSVSACIASYTPPEWGKFLNAVFRRAQPDGRDAWDVQLIATYEKAEGFSGVCIYTRVEQVGEIWQIAGWSGWIHCGDASSGLANLMRDDAPNRAP